MNLYPVMFASLLGLYVSYAVRLGSAFRMTWQKMEPEERNALNLAILAVTCIFWPVLTPLCYLELLSRPYS